MHLIAASKVLSTVRLLVQIYTPFETRAKCLDISQALHHTISDFVAGSTERRRKVSILLHDMNASLVEYVPRRVCGTAQDMAKKGEDVEIVGHTARMGVIIFLSEAMRYSAWSLKVMSWFNGDFSEICASGGVSY
jgi:hypothetical protein